MPGQRRRFKGSGHSCVSSRRLRQSEPKRRQEKYWRAPMEFLRSQSRGILSCFLRRAAGCWEAGIDAVSIWQDVVTHFEQIEKHLLDDVLVFANLIQIPAVILTGGAAWLVCRPIRRWTTRWVERVPEDHHFDWVVSHRSWVTDRLVPLITPMAWAIGLWISVTVAERAGWPHAVAQTAVSLLLAWLVIRLAAALVPYAALARLIAVLAWLVA